MKQSTVLAQLAAMSLGLVLLAPAGAAPRTRCFVETGYCITRPFLDYWERGGGLHSFSYPLSVVRSESAEG
jgi:hypothetical protein